MTTNFTGTAGNDTLAGTSGDDLIQGLGGNDILSGGIGNDQLEGGADDDSLNGGAGNDLVTGGDGRDTLVDDSGGNDQLEGGEGGDYITISRFLQAAATVNRMDGGAGDDFFGIYDDSRKSTFDVSAGDGNDRFWIRGATTLTIDLGLGDDFIEFEGLTATVSLALAGGSDRIRINGQNTAFGGTITATGFDTGAGGDWLDIDEYLALNLGGWDGRTNPYASGHMRLVQSGADALLQVDWNGGGDGYATFITFVGTSAASLTAFNLGGWPSDGSVPAGLTLVGDVPSGQVLRGSAGADLIQALDGRDEIWGGSGDDHLQGGGGQDWIYGGLGDDLIEGGDGNDILFGDLRGADIIRGGEGNDGITVSRSTPESGLVEMDGGGGDDVITAVAWQPADNLAAVFARYRILGGDGADAIVVYRVTEAEVDAGAGDDLISLDTYTNAVVTLGGGNDVLRLDQLRGFFFTGRTITVTDFQAGDRLEWTDYLVEALPTWDRNSNPFGSFLRLVQSGPDTLVQICNSGNALEFWTLVTLQNVQASTLGQFNMGGFPPDGSVPVGFTLVGTPGADRLNGEAGGDVLSGLGSDDTLHGGGGDDLLYGGDGRDQLNGGYGNDRLEGGADWDFLSDSSGGSDSLYGGDGRDDLYVERNGAPVSTLLLDGGADGDWLRYVGNYNQLAAVNLTMFGGDGDDQIVVNGRANAAIDAGAGDDSITLYTDPGQYSLTLGAGADRVELWADLVTTGLITIADFEVAGDRLDLNNFFAAWLTGWDGVQSPFASGYARLLESGGSTLLQVDRNGGGDGYATLVILSGISPLYLTPTNFGGFDPVTRGTAGADQMTGHAAGDLLDGRDGNDLFLLQQGGDDGALGGAGSDVFYFGAAFTGADRADGGADRDVVVLQGNYALTLSAINLTGVESLSLQSGSRTVWGDTADNFYDYAITTHDSNVAAGQQLIVNGQTLRAGEDFSFDGSAETDGFFLVYGGNGVDTLKGGAGNDAFFFEGARWGAGDSVNGGAGRDALIISGGNGVTHIEFGANALTGIESISLNARYATDPTARPSYELVLDNGNVAPGASLIVNGNSLVDPLQTVSVDGSTVRDGTLILIGGAGNDVLKAGYGGDTLLGGDGADLLQGGEGVDLLTGGAGADTFRYASPYDSTSQVPDRILDFVSGADKIDLAGIDADLFAAGDQAFHWIGSNAFTGSGASSAGELRAWLSGGSWFVEGDMDGNGAADLVIQLTAPAAPVVQGDFLL